jgi:hypothetical protein
MKNQLPKVLQWALGEVREEGYQLSYKVAVELEVHLQGCRPVLDEAYPWFDDENLRGFEKHLKGAIMGAFNRLPGQVNLHKKECLDLYSADRADYTIDLAKKMGVEGVRHFATAEPRFPMNVRGRGHSDWWVTPADHYEKEIPMKYMDLLTRLRLNGAEPDRYAIAEPVIRRVRDPILLACFGDYMVELGRWE